MIRAGGFLFVGLALAALAAPASLASEAGVAQHLSGAEKFNPKVETIRLFDGIGSGKLEVRVTAEGANLCRLRITNKTAEPLNVIMPAAFAAVPVSLVNLQEQQPPGDGQLPDGEDVPPPEDPQKLGVGCPYADGSELNTYSFVPNRAAVLQLRAVCLEHDRPGPSPKHHYEVRRMDQVTSVKGVYEICAMMGRGEIDHQVAQFAAWHLNNQLSWKQLWSQSQHGAGMGGREGVSQRQIFEAIEAVERAVQESWSKVTSLCRTAAGRV